MEREALSEDDFLARFSAEELFISAVSASELLHGLHRAGAERRRQMRSDFAERMLLRFPVIPFDLKAARVHASLWAALARRGRSIGERDLMIGATAIAHNQALATRDRRSFPRITGLKIELI